MTSWWSLARPATIELVWCIAPERDKTRKRRKGIVAVVYMNVDLNRMHTTEGFGPSESQFNCTIVKEFKSFSSSTWSEEVLRRRWHWDECRTNCSAFVLTWHTLFGACMNESEPHLSATHETVFVFWWNSHFFCLFNKLGVLKTCETHQFSSDSDFPHLSYIFHVIVTRNFPRNFHTFSALSLLAVQEPFF